jgi:uncharacterized membrane protein
MTVLPVHIVAGVVALLAGYVALAAGKGRLLHRKSGLVFVLAMMAMSLTGALMALLNGSSVSIVAGLLTFYFVTTALLAVRRQHASTFRLDAAAMAWAVVLALFAFKTGADLAGTGRPEAAPMFVFGLVGVLAAVGDARMIRDGGVQGTRRIARHLWRMCFAMWVAAASFFWGPPGRVPEIIYIPALLPIPVLLPLAVMLYWLWRLRIKQSLRGIAVNTSGAARPVTQ